LQSGDWRFNRHFAKLQRELGFVDKRWGRSMLRRLKINGFKRLREIDLEMRPLMVLIGANGAGKTSLLDAVSMLSAIVNSY
jgi:ABC-type multidrug transport system ATPase subunit